MQIMIFCVCNNINTAKVEAAAEAGASCPKSVLKHHGKRFNCGQCRCDLKAYLDDRHAAQIAQPLMLAAE